MYTEYYEKRFLYMSIESNFCERTYTHTHIYIYMLKYFILTADITGQEILYY